MDRYAPRWQDRRSAGDPEAHKRGEWAQKVNAHPLYRTDIATNSHSHRPGTGLDSQPHAPQHVVFGGHGVAWPPHRSEANRLILVEELYSLSLEAKFDELWDTIMFLKDKSSDFSLEESDLASGSDKPLPLAPIETQAAPSLPRSSHALSPAAISQAYLSSHVSSLFSEEAARSMASPASSHNPYRDSDASRFSTASTCFDPAELSKHSTMSSFNSLKDKSMLMEDVMDSLAGGRNEHRGEPITAATTTTTTRRPTQKKLKSSAAADQASSMLLPAAAQDQFKTPHHCTYGCGQVIARKSDWIRHEDSQHDPQFLYSCGLDSVNQPELRCASSRCSAQGLSMTAQHLAAAHSSRSCHKDGEPPARFAHVRRDKLLKHMRLSHGIVATRVPPQWIASVAATPDFGCGFCGAHLRDWDARCDHVSEHFAAFAREGRAPPVWDRRLADEGRAAAAGVVGMERLSLDEERAGEEELSRALDDRPDEDALMHSPTLQSVMALLEDRGF